MTRLLRMIGRMPWLEPWYDWGTVETFSLRLLADKAAGPYGDETTGGVRFWVIQWLGIHLEVQVGRTPRHLGPRRDQ